MFDKAFAVPQEGVICYDQRLIYCTMNMLWAVVSTKTVVIVLIPELNNLPLIKM